MSRHLFALLLALTLLDLGFVQATDVVPSVELLPLWALAVAAPCLRPLQRHALHRGAWNACVVLVFALLVHHATTSGLLHMLEDGLVLAVLCQVHLLNNIGERQRPDLLFFNSFLIAFVTSFFTTDATWSALFLAHAFVLVPSLQLYSLTRSNAPLSRALVRGVWRDCVPRTLAIVGVTAVAFVLLPRDFRREGWLGETFALGQQFEAGLAERIRIDDEHTARLPENVVARITPLSGRAEDVPAHWRANAFSTFTANAWTPQNVATLGTRCATDPVWQHHADGSIDRDLPSGHGTRLRMQLFALDSNRLPVPLNARAVAPLGTSPVTLSPRGDGAIKMLPTGDSTAPGLECTVDLAASGGAVAIAPHTRAHMTALPDDLPAVVYELAARLRGSAPDDADTLALASADCEWLQRNRRYQLPGQPGFAHGLGEFLIGSGAGHCEYFATALALLLRAQRQPCRLVGGWLATEWDATGHAVVVRGKHAHAWVEVLTEDGSWHTFDPTPAQDVLAGGAGDDWLAALRAQIERWWAAVAGFDQATRSRWLASLAAAPVEHPFACSALLAAAVSFVLLRRRRPQALPAIVKLHRALRRAGLSLRCGETTRELLARAAGAGLEPDAWSCLQTAARDHESSRYAARCERR